MVTTSDRALWARMWAYKDHGKSWEAVYEREHAPGFRWLHESFGTNWRMTEIQAAQQLPGLRVPEVPKECEHAAYKGYVFVKPEQLQPGWNRDRLVQEINQRGVPCYTGSCSEVYLEKAFDNTGWRPESRLPVAKELGETSLMFLVHPGIGQEDMEKTVQVLAAVMHEGSGKRV